MIKIPGHLAIRTIQGRNGAFNVGRLSTSIGEFVIKDAVLEQHVEGKYRGEFVITEIRASSYSTGGRLVIEIRARLDSMVLEDIDELRPTTMRRSMRSRRIRSMKSNLSRHLRQRLDHNPPVPPGQPALRSRLQTTTPPSGCRHHQPLLS